MKRLVAAGLAAVAALASTAATAPEQVTMVARPTLLAPSQAVTLFGTVDSERADEIVTIQARDCGASSQLFQGVTASRTRAGGGWSVEYTPRITTTLRAHWNGKFSPPVTVRQRAIVFFAPLAFGNGFRVGVSGKVQFWRKRVLVQRFDRQLGTWATVRSVVLTETGGGGGGVGTWAEFKMTVPRRTLLRAVFPLSQAAPCYLAGTSKLVRT